MLERRGVVGGAAVTEEFHPGFRNSVASYTVSLLNPKVIARHGPGRATGLRIVERRALQLPAAGRRALSDRRRAAAPRPRSRNSRSRTPRRLGAYGERARGHRRRAARPGAEDAAQRRAGRLVGGAAGAAAGPCGSAAARQARHDLRRDLLDAVRPVARATVWTAGSRATRSRRLFGFDAIVGNYASPYTPGSAYVLLHHVFGEVNGKKGAWGHAIGGMGAITQAMAQGGGRAAASRSAPAPRRAR